MNIFEQYTQRQGAMNFKDILNFSPLTRAQQKHLTRVYAALLSNIILAALGVYVQQRFLPFVSPMLLLGLQLFSLWTLGSSSTDAVYSGKVSLLSFFLWEREFIWISTRSLCRFIMDASRWWSAFFFSFVSVFSRDRRIEKTVSFTFSSRQTGRS